MRKRTKMLVALGIVLVPVAVFLVRTRIPVKYAVNIEDISQYPNCILVQEAWHTGTGWEQVGDERGYLPAEDRNDVYLIGKLPPPASIGGDHFNTYLCEVTYLGEDNFPAIGDADTFDKYEVLEWHPIYPVKRDTLFPSWVYPKGYFSISDNID